MRIVAVDVYRVTLPFRFSFGHSLAARSSSENIVVRVRLADGTEGYGEGVPRDYVTGEDALEAAARIKAHYAPRFINVDVSDRNDVLARLSTGFLELGLDRQAHGASWCAFELAVLDAVARAHRLAVQDWLGGAKVPAVQYGAVVPFCSPKAHLGILAFYRLYGFRTVKVKVGRDLDVDLERVRVARAILGPAVTLRVDANCAWTADQAIAAAESMRRFGVISIEQPVPPGDLDGLVKITRSVPEEIVVDESLCTTAQAEELIAAGACTAFNIRLSKVGGLLAARRMAELARSAGVAVHLGAQVGESGILSAAARAFAVLEYPLANYEGSDNAFLLKKDLTRENLTVGLRGYGRALPGAGFGFTVSARRLAEISSPDDDAADPRAGRRGG
ncbi:MAG TPA: enolase C-terminal domain-like protein, partial [Candidatus Obscuribacterales bacterium]